MSALGGLAVCSPATQADVALSGQAIEPNPPSLNFYGLPGLIDMPSASQMPDGQFGITVSNLAGQTRATLSFQPFPRVTASFRYASLQDLNLGGFETFRDRSFDVRFQLATEGRVRPSVVLGLQDFAGTGIYSGEYIVATKSFDRPLTLPGRARVTAGVGWGRLGSADNLGTPFGSNRDGFDPGDEGGVPEVGAWFQGPASVFGGIEWELNDRLGVKAEYSSDTYELESDRGIIDQKSRLNFGIEYQYSDSLRLGGYWLYGSELGVTAQLQFNPNNSPAPLSLSGPRPIIERPSRASNPSAWTTDWAQSANIGATIRDALLPELTEDGLTLEALAVSATSVDLRVSNRRYRSMTVAVGRAARVLARILPPSVETFRITPVEAGLPLSTVVIRRSDLERLEFEPDATGALLARTRFDEAAPALEAAVRDESLFPEFSWNIGPYLSPSYFDPDVPARADVGIAASLLYQPAPGWRIGGQVRARIAGNIDDGDPSNSVLPRVRTDADQYAAATDTPLTELYVARNWKPADDLYARVTVGYLESMFGGISSELLWKPQDSRLALGVEANYVRQRDFDQGFGFQDYEVFTGHASVYYEFEKGYLAQVDAGRYLAGDNGATFRLTREFDNGWRVGGFFTLTDVSAEEFGEGSFDKGIELTIPINWFSGRASRQTVRSEIRPVQRDGGARLNVPGRLYEEVRSGHQQALTSTWSQVWE